MKGTQLATLGRIGLNAVTQVTFGKVYAAFGGLTVAPFTIEFSGKAATIKFSGRKPMLEFSGKKPTVKISVK